jgi:rod shape-determining protein MreC
MKVLMSKRNIIIFAAAVLVAAVAVISVNTSRGSGFITEAVNFVIRPVKSVAASVARTFESIYGYMYEYDKVVAENNKLNERIAQLQEDYREYTDMSDENARLHELLGLSARHSDFRYDTATILTWGSNNYSSSFTISKGSGNSEVAVGDAVITETGVLIGRITEVEAVSSTAVSVIDTTFSAGVLTGGFGETGVAAGDFNLMRSGELKLDFLPDDTAVLSGDEVITSGKGGVFPEGLVIGEVTQVHRNPSGIGAYATVKPAAELRNVNFVFVVVDFVKSE